MWKVVLKIATNFGDFHKEEVTHKVRIPRHPSFNLDWLIGFFDGASQDASLKCGVGAVFKLNESCSYKLKMGCGNGTNTSGELLALWSLLHFAYSK